MEVVIARLLSEFESGRLSRRELVKTLAMVAIGAPVAASATASASPVAPWKTVWLDHISFQVSDYKKSVQFYTDLMGWHVKEDTGSQAALDINGIGGIIIRNGPRHAQGAEAAKPAGGPAITGVIDHISWGVKPWDKDAVRAALEKRNLEPVADMKAPDFESFHVKDPDGWDLQISNQTKERHD